MRVLMIMYDTLCRHFLAPYGNDWVKTPNFTRLAENSVTFDSNYVCSLPCMPARRDMHNGRANFLFRDWGPLEPYDDSMPEILKQNGIYSCLVSDHYHYWEDGGATYHTRYSSWKANRGQEGDFVFADKEMLEKTQELKGQLHDPQFISMLMHKQDEVNRRHIDKETLMPQYKTFADGMDFLKENVDRQNWFLQIETFDPHEPFFTQPEWKKLYPELAEYVGTKSDWPSYDPVRESDGPKDIEYVRKLYAALIAMCDDYLGKILDFMDEHEMWKDTMLMVLTDHGFLLGEHDWWGKSIMPSYEEISHTPLFIYDPVSGIKNQRRSKLSSMIDIPATILDFFGLPLPEDMTGRSLLPLIRENKAIRQDCLFGFHGGHIGYTDGKYTYFRAPLAEKETVCYEYTLMPTRMRQRFSIEDLKKAEYVDPFAGSKGCKVLKIPAHLPYVSQVNFGTKLFDVENDPRQKQLIDDPVLEAKLAIKLKEAMLKEGAPAEQFERLGLDQEITPESIRTMKIHEEEILTPKVEGIATWSKEAANVYRTMKKMLPADFVEYLNGQLAKDAQNKNVDLELMKKAIRTLMPEHQADQIIYFMAMVSRTY